MVTILFDRKMSLMTDELRDVMVIHHTFCSRKKVAHLGKPSFQKSAVFFNIVQKAFDPPPLLFEHLSYFAGGVF